MNRMFAALELVCVLPSLGKPPTRELQSAVNTRERARSTCRTRRFEVLTQDKPPAVRAADAAFEGFAWHDYFGAPPRQYPPPRLWVRSTRQAG